VSCWAVTDVGLKREDNEDSYLVDTSLQLYIVADGMGGHAGGGTASRMAVESVRSRVLELKRTGTLFDKTASERESLPILQELNQAISTASGLIFEASNQRPELAGMGTTLTLLLLHGRRAYVAHVGDSRLYRLRDGGMHQLTEDHSLVNEQVKAGFITAEEAQHSRFRNIITRSVGFESQVAADAFSLPTRAGDVFLLCSDGLSGMVGDKELHSTLVGGRLSDAPARLVAQAKKGGGEDNITLVILRVGAARGRRTT
jgi:protein phosphatase